MIFKRLNSSLASQALQTTAKMGNILTQNRGTIGQILIWVFVASIALQLKQERRQFDDLKLGILAKKFTLTEEIAMLRGERKEVVQKSPIQAISDNEEIY